MIFLVIFTSLSGVSAISVYKIKLSKLITPRKVQLSTKTKQKPVIEVSCFMGAKSDV